MKRADLKEKLDLVQLGLADNSLVPAFQCFCFKKDAILAYNDQIGVQYNAPGRVDEEFVVHGKTFFGLLKNSTAENLEFKLHDNDIVIKADRSTFTLPYTPVEDFIFEEPEMGSVVLQLDQNLIEGLKSCLTTTSTDQAQPALMGVSLVTANTLFACDGDAVTKYTLGTKPGTAHPYFMSNSFCNAVLQIAETTECTDGAVSFSDEWVVADFDNGYTVYGRLIQNDNLIDFDALIEKTVKGKPVFAEVPFGLNEALSRARIIGTAETAPTVFKVEANRLKLQTEARAGRVQESLAMGKHEEVLVKLSAEMVQRTIHLCDEICLMKNCLVARRGTKLLQVVSSMDT